MANGGVAHLVPPASAIDWKQVLGETGGVAKSWQCGWILNNADVVGRALGVGTAGGAESETTEGVDAAG